jgi:hypothetical protein
VIPESTDLKVEIAPCWKLVWNVEPAPLIVPVADEALVLVLADELAAGDELDVAAGVVELDDEDDEHAARAMAAATAPDAAATCLPRNCIREFSL